MNTPLKVLVVDDSAAFRRLLTVALERDPGIKVVGTARDGAVALEHLQTAVPNVVTLDLDMPTLDGMATLREMRRRHPALPILVVSAATTRGARSTYDALAAGATDYFAKPSSLEGATLDSLSTELVARVRTIAASRVTPALRVRPFGELAPRLLVVGASTGGPEAITQLLVALHHPLPVPILLVQHMPASFTPVFAERLAARLGVDVREAVDGAPVRAGEVRLAPGDRHLTVRKDKGGLVLGVTRDPPENSCRPSVDVTLRTAVEACGERVLSVILTGVGTDGRAGCARVSAAGGRVFAQDEGTSVVWGMPGAVARAGLAHRIGPIRDLAVAIQQAFARVEA